MTAFATKGLMRLLDDAFRCPDCGKSRIQKATDWTGNTSGVRGESVHRPKSYEAFDPEVHCCCPRSGLRSIPYIRTNAAGDGSGEAKAARPDADGSHQPPALPQPCSLPCPREAMDAADVG